MPLDHTEFIQRQSFPDPGAFKKSKPKAWRQWALALSFLFFYICACIAVAIVMDVDRVTAVLSGLLFIITAILAYWAQRSLYGIRNLERERRLIREVLEGSRGARLITDSAENTVYYNERLYLLCGGEQKPSLEKLSALFDKNPDIYRRFQKLADQARLGLTESIALQSDEGIREKWFQVTAQPVAGWAGFVHWRIDDITKDREIERSVRHEREKLIDFTDNAPVGFFSVNEDGRFIFVNATLARWLGEDIQTLLETGHLHTYMAKPPYDAAPYDVVEGGGARQVAELTMKGPGGRTFLASINQAVVRESEGSVRTRGVVHDLTQEREMRKALQASEDKFQRFFDEAPVGIAMIDSEGALKDYNTAFQSLISPVQKKNLDGHEIKDFVHADDRLHFTKSIYAIKPGERMSAPMELTLLSAEGREITVQTHARRFKQSDSTVLHFIDLTEQKNLEEQFVQSQKMQAVGQLAGGVAHDFNNLLTAIIGFCDLLLLRHKPGDPSFGDIMQIKQNSNRAANLVRQLLAFSRQQTLRPRVHDISEILTEVSHLLRRLIGANIDLELVHGDDMGLVKVDVGQMEQVLINLAVNARDAMPGGGHLTIETGSFKNKEPLYFGEDEMPPGEWVSIAVTDTGTGITKENLSRILEPFFTTKEVGQGTGLGLATVYGIVRQTGGYLAVDSTVGEGTTFTLYLPKLDEDYQDNETVTHAHKEEAAGDLTGSACILLVEDEDAVRTFSTRALMNKGYEVEAADNGVSALNLLEGMKDRKIDLLITDVMMPDMDGPTLAQRLRQDNPKLKIIFMSGYTEDKLKDHMGENITFLPKPFTLKQLALKVKEALDA
jgi:two-component system cell cycle sensor histidine kinase/response regulator CckA